MNLRESKQKTTSWTKQHKIISVAVVLILVFGGVFGYNKYLDWRNVQDMKSLVGAFEQLELAAEEAIGGEYFIEASCGKGGEKFSTTYSCRLVLPEEGIEPTNYHGISLDNDKVNNSRCETLVSGKNNYKNSIRCDIVVRQANINKSRSIFDQYDTSY